MLFNSFEFILVYLPAVLLGFFCLARASHRLAALWLAAASLVFYGWLTPGFIPLLLVSVVANYLLGRWLYRLRGSPATRPVLALGIGANLVLLAFFKYAKFLVITANAVADSSFALPEITLPLGISFFTFTQIAFLVDVAKGEASEYRFVHYLLFVTYFPHLIAGPIIHHKQMMPQFGQASTYVLRLANLAPGLSMFAIGLAKKVLLADNLALYANPVFDTAAQGVVLDYETAWIGVLAYALQLYFDFSGYSDMAVGLSRLFGISLPVNFDSPYKSRSIIDFWRRWHITLSQFLQQYLYIPLGGNRRGKARRYLNLMLTMLLGGLWHGANWTFVVWGGLHGAYLAVNHGWRALTAGRAAPGYLSPRTVDGMKLLLTFACVTLAWIFFRADTGHTAWLLIQSCLGADGPMLFFAKTSLILFELGPRSMLAAGLAIAWWAPNSQQIVERILAIEQAAGQAGARRWRLSLPAAGLAMGCLLCLGLSSLNKVSSFLYYQF